MQMARKAERKTGLVTQLDEDALCRLIGYTACMVQFVCGAHSLYVHCLWSRAKTLVVYVLLHFSEA